MYSEEFKDWAKSKGLYREFDGYISHASNLSLFWEAYQSAKSSERELADKRVAAIAADRDYWREHCLEAEKRLQDLGA